MRQLEKALQKHYDETCRLKYEYFENNWNNAFIKIYEQGHVHDDNAIIVIGRDPFELPEVISEYESKLLLEEGTKHHCSWFIITKFRISDTLDVVDVFQKFDLGLDINYFNNAKFLENYTSSKIIHDAKQFKSAIEVAIERYTSLDPKVYIILEIYDERKHHKKISLEEYNELYGVNLAEIIYASKMKGIELILTYETIYKNYIINYIDKIKFYHEYSGTLIFEMDADDVRFTDHDVIKEIVIKFKNNNTKPRDVTDESTTNKTIVTEDKKDKMETSIKYLTLVDKNGKIKVEKITQLRAINKETMFEDKNFDDTNIVVSSLSPAFHYKSV